MLGVLAALSIGAIIIIGYEISQNYKKTKKMANINLNSGISQVKTTNLDYNLISDEQSRVNDDLGLQNL